MTEEEFLTQELHTLKKAAECFKSVNELIRNRKRCVSRDKFEEGIKALDGMAENIFKRMQNKEAK